MKVHCPRCSGQLLATNINLEIGWGKCETCQELFALADVVSGFPTARSPQPITRPFNARAIVERTAEELLIYIPPEGMRAGGCGLLGFATFWLGFVAFWTVGALGLFAGQPPGAFNWVFASFSIPFWLVGFGMVAGFAWQVWGIKSIRIDRDGMRTYQRCLVWVRSKWIELDRVQHARSYQPPVKNGEQPRRTVEIVYRAGSFVLPADSEEEAQWLITEINDFVKSIAA